MSAVVVNRLVHGRYLDSVSLMRISRSLSALPGVAEAAVMIGSQTNKDLMRESGLLGAQAEAAQASDLVVGVRATDEASAARALEELDTLLSRQSGEHAQHGARRARSLAGAARALPDANLALVSVPGEFAAAEAAKALSAGLNVLLFSNNVGLEDELRLKRLARERGLLLMGPDCGTSLIGGVPLAFANVVPRGGIGVVAASGTGLQEVTTLVARHGGGISHGVGVGGRDLREEIGGITTLMAIDALDADPATSHIVVISKPPAPRVAAAVLERIARSAKPFTVCLLGEARLDLPRNARRAGMLREAAELALGGGPFEPEFVRGVAWPRARGRVVRGLYCGGTLCAEAQLVLRRAGERVQSNAPVPGAEPLAEASASGPRTGTSDAMSGAHGAAAAGVHTIVDLGADEYTRGRPHPMIEPEIRNAPLLAALRDAATGAVLLDLVIGYGAHADPAGIVAAALATAPPEHAPVIASVCGTEQDPQVYSRQVRALQAAGAIVAPSNAHAAELALAAVRAG